LWCLVLFRIVGVSQDLTPATGSMTIYVRVSEIILLLCVFVIYEDQ